MPRLLISDDATQIFNQTSMEVVTSYGPVNVSLKLNDMSSPLSPRRMSLTSRLPLDLARKAGCSRKARQ